MQIQRTQKVIEKEAKQNEKCERNHNILNIIHAKKAFSKCMIALHTFCLNSNLETEVFIHTES